MVLMEFPDEDIKKFVSTHMVQEDEVEDKHAVMARLESSRTIYTQECDKILAKLGTRNVSQAVGMMLAQEAEEKKDREFKPPKNSVFVEEERKHGEMV